MNKSRQEGKVTGISYKEKDTGQRVSCARHTFPKGKISLISTKALEGVSASKQMGLCMRRFKGDLETQGIDYDSLKEGQILKIGELTISVTQVGKKCHAKECPVFDADRKCFMMEEVLFGEVGRAGKVAVNDKIEVER